MGNEEIDNRELISYFAYGSNMNPERMRERGVVFYSRELLVLSGWTLKFHKITIQPNKGAANIISDKSGYVEGILYQITMQGIYNLDKFEHYPTEYDRVAFMIPDGNGAEKEIYTYLAHPHKTREGLKPSRSYLEHLLAAEDILSEDYYNQLIEVETLD